MIRVSYQLTYYFFYQIKKRLRGIHSKQKTIYQTYCQFEVNSIFQMIEMAGMRQLEQQNRILRSEVESWKLKYYNLQRMYKLTLENNAVRGTQPQIIDKDGITQAVQNTIESQENEGNNSQKSEEKVENDDKTSPTQSNDERDLQQRSQITQPFQINKKEEEPLKLSLITGCFMLEKRRSSYYNPIKCVYPSALGSDHSSLYDAIYRFVFIEDAIQEIIDDEEESRKKQILYGSNYEDFHFVFDDYKNLPLKNLTNEFLSETNLMRKQHVYGMIRPETLMINDNFYETEIAIGFMSQVPIFPFFRDLSRVIQQQIKLSLLSSQTNPRFQDRIEAISGIITNICKFSIDSKLEISKFPLYLSIDAPLCTISLKYSSSESFLFDQLNSAQGIIHNYSKKKLTKIIHYLLAEKSMIIICRTRKSLNQLFQILRMILHPLNWIFPIVYSYSAFYQPFLNSPLPILIGYVKREYYQDWELAVDSENEFLPTNDLVHIKAQSEDSDINQIATLEKRIKKCNKWVGKELKEDAIMKEQLVTSPFAKKIAQNKLCFKYHYYVQQILKACQPSSQEEPDDFLLSFKESQMLSYYKQDSHQQ